MMQSAVRHDVWWADQVGPAVHPIVSTGWPSLDAVLPGQGWPLGALTEYALETDAPPWRLLLPALQAAARQGHVALIGLRWQPNVHAWAAQGLAPQRLLRLQTNHDAEALWAAEQVLRCPQIALCWVHWQRPTANGMRRLQLAAARAQCDHTLPEAWPAPLVWASYDAAHALPTSVAPLRLAVAAGNSHGLSVQIRKRRGPPLDAPVWLDAPLPLQRLCACIDSPQRPAPHVTESPVDRLPAHRRRIAA